MTSADAPHLAIGRRFIAANPPPGRAVQCGLTGSHVYGFTSPDSDIDLKGVHVAPTDTVLGLDSVREAHDALEVSEGIECDYTSNEVGQALTLLLSGNGNMLERLLSPTQLIDSPETDALRELALGAISKRFSRHYRGFLKGMLREATRTPTPTAKNLLYAYRVALTGTHLLRTGELILDVNDLAMTYQLADVAQLAELKRTTKEKHLVDAQLAAVHLERTATLDGMLVAALEASNLPDEPPNRAAANDWLVALRRAE